MAFGILGIITENPIIGLIVLASIIGALSVHEAAHAFIADKLGDNTPRMQGRITLNPMAHLDLWGTMLLLVAGIGWGKPVMFNPFNLKNPRTGAAIIALAGPMSNVAMAIIISVLMKIFGSFDASGIFVAIGGYFVTINLALAVFNLIPVEPLDGFKVVAGILPPHLAYQWQDTRQYGLIILLILLFTGIIDRFVFPLVNLIAKILL